MRNNKAGKSRNLSITFLYRIKFQCAVLASCDPSSHDAVVVMEFEFCTHSARLLRKLNHVLLWILSTNTGLWQCSICAEKINFQWIAMFCLYTLPLARPAQAKIQMLTTSSRIVTILFKILFKNLRTLWYVLPYFKFGES